MRAVVVALIAKAGRACRRGTAGPTIGRPTEADLLARLSGGRGGARRQGASAERGGVSLPARVCLERLTGTPPVPDLPGQAARVIVVTEPGQPPDLLRDQVRCPECGAVPRGALKRIVLWLPAVQRDGAAGDSPAV